MNKPDLTIPSKPVIPGDSFPLKGKTPSPYWMSVDWLALAMKRWPDVNLVLNQDCHEDWLLFDQIDILAEQMEVDYVDAANWALQRALGDRFQSAREMFAELKMWDAEILYVCTIFGVQLCNFFTPKETPDTDRVFHMIETLLISDEELLMNTRAKNSMPC